MFIGNVLCEISNSTQAILIVTESFSLSRFITPPSFPPLLSHGRFLCLFFSVVQVGKTARGRYKIPQYASASPNVDTIYCDSPSKSSCPIFFFSFLLSRFYHFRVLFSGKQLTHFRIKS